MCNDETFQAVQREFEQWRASQLMLAMKIEMSDHPVAIDVPDCFENNYGVATMYDGEGRGWLPALHAGRCDIEADLERRSPSASYRLWVIDPRELE